MATVPKGFEDSIAETPRVSRRNALLGIGAGSIGLALGFKSRLQSALQDSYEASTPDPTLAESVIFKKEAKETIEDNCQFLVQNPEQIAIRRELLKADIWRDGNVLPEDLPCMIQQNTKGVRTDWPMQELQHLAGDMYHLNFKDTHPDYEEAFNYDAFYFKNRNNLDDTQRKLMILHQGHGGWDENSFDLLGMRLIPHMDVLYLNMPNVQTNFMPTPIGDAKQYGGCGHERMGNFEREDLNPLRYFFSQIPSAIAQTQNINNSEFAEMHMAGISGGGFTVDVYAGLDERILKSFAFNGTIPHAARLPDENGWEDGSHQSIFKHLNLEQLMIAASIGEGRGHYKMRTNEPHEWGAGQGRHGLYIDAVYRAVEQMEMGGEFGYHGDQYAVEHRSTDVLHKVLLRKVGILKEPTYGTNMLTSL